MFLISTMDSDSKSPSDDSVPDFFSDDKKNIEKLSNKKNDSISLVNTQPKIRKERSSRTIHWASLGIGAGIAIACIFCGVLLVNMINTDTTQVLDEITIKEITKILSF